MAFATGHGENFPHVFHRCEQCGAKQVYIIADGDNEIMMRCKACKREKFIPQEQWLGTAMEVSLFAIDFNAVRA